MNDQKNYRIAGVSALASIATCFIEFPFYLVRTAWPGLTASDKLGDFAAPEQTQRLASRIAAATSRGRTESGSRSSAAASHKPRTA